MPTVPTLTNLTEFPPWGYLYREPALNWSVPPDLAMQGLQAVADAVRMVRMQNPASGLDPSYSACVEAVKRYTCARLAQNPDALRRYCSSVETQALAPSQRDMSQPTRRSRVGCASCGRR